MFGKPVRAFNLGSAGRVYILFEDDTHTMYWFWDDDYNTVLHWCIAILMGHRPLNAPPTLHPTVEELPLMHPETQELVS